MRGRCTRSSWAVAALARAGECTRSRASAVWSSRRKGAAGRGQRRTPSAAASEDARNGRRTHTRQREHRAHRNPRSRASSPRLTSSRSPLSRRNVGIPPLLSSCCSLPCERVVEQHAVVAEMRKRRGDRRPVVGGRDVSRHNSHSSVLAGSREIMCSTWRVRSVSLLSRRGCGKAGKRETADSPRSAALRRTGRGSSRCRRRQRAEWKRGWRARRD